MISKTYIRIDRKRKGFFACNGSELSVPLFIERVKIPLGALVESIENNMEFSVVWTFHFALDNQLYLLHNQK